MIFSNSALLHACNIGNQTLLLSYSSHLIVVVVGFVETLVEVNETDGNATLDVSISFPLPAIPGVPEFQLMFTLLVGSTDGSAGRDGVPQSSDFS